MRSAAPAADAGARMFLELSGVSKRFGEVVAVDGVSLGVEEGEFVCFLGPSGCGKTTLLRVVAGLEIADAGEIRLAGQDLAPVPARLRNFGVVFQSYSLFPNMTVAKNVAYGLECRKWPAERSRGRVEAMLALVHLADQADKHPEQLSGGQQQRVALARALAPEPPVLLLDEPLSALDAKVREELRGEIRDLQKELGITTVMVTHDQDEAMEMADRIVVMSQGRIAQIGTAFELYTQPANRFVAEFIGRMNVLQLSPGPEGRPSLCGQPLGLGGAAERAALIGVRPEDVVLGAPGPDGIRVQGVVEKAVFLGNVTRVTLELADQKLLVELRGRTGRLERGAPLDVCLPREAITVLHEG
jgi:iron(III) transport system ATP-binding protein